MAEQTSHRADVAHMPQGHAAPSTRTYVNIFAVLFLITLLEVFASYMADIGLPLWSEIATLILLSAVKGVLVVMFYMHLRFDSRWFTSLFAAGFGIAVFMVIVFLLLWAYKRAVGGLVV